MMGQRRPKRKAGVMDLVRAVTDPDLIETIEYIKSNKEEIKLALEQLKEAAGQRSLKEVLGDIERHAEMVEKTLKHVQLLLRINAKLHPKEYDEALKEVNATWARMREKGKNGESSP